MNRRGLGTLSLRRWDILCESNICVSWFTSELTVRLVLLNMFKPSTIFTDRSMVLFFLFFFCFVFLFCFFFWGGGGNLFCSCYSFLSVPCSLVITSWRKGWPLDSLVCYVFCVFVTFQYGVLGRVWCLILSIPDFCLLPYFALRKQN